MSDSLADSGQWIYDSVLSFINDETMDVHTAKTVQIIGYCSEEKFFEFSDRSTSIYGILKADSCKELILPSTESDIVGLILSLYDFYYTITPIVNLLSRRSMNITGYENTIIIVINKCRVVSNGLASPIMNSRSILDYPDVKSLIASKPFGPLGKHISNQNNTNFNNVLFSQEESERDNNNNNNLLQISPKLKEAISSELILFDEDELETQQQSNNNEISILYTKNNSLLSNINQPKQQQTQEEEEEKSSNYITPIVPLREVSELDELIVNKITDLQFKQSYLSNKQQQQQQDNNNNSIISNSNNYSITTQSPAVLNDLQLGIQQHDVSLIYKNKNKENNNKKELITTIHSHTTSSSSSSSSSSPISNGKTDSIDRNNNVNNNIQQQQQQQLMQKRKHHKIKKDYKDITYIDCDNSSDSEEEIKVVKKKSKVGHHKYNIVNIDDIPSAEYKSLGRKKYPIEVDESTLQSIRVAPNAVAKSFINKFKHMRNNT